MSDPTGLVKASDELSENQNGRAPVAVPVADTSPWLLRAVVAGGVLMVASVILVLVLLNQASTRADKADAARDKIAAAFVNDVQTLRAQVTTLGETPVVAAPTPAAVAAVTGAAGPPGVPGSPGRDGAPGSQGPVGAPGKDGAVGPTGPTGLAGKDGVPGLPGAVGATGPSGSPGVPGVSTIGPAGANGADGVDGAAGPAGPAGANGADGASGSPGANGANGLNGTDGAAGPPGPPLASFTFTTTSGITFVCSAPDPAAPTVFTCI